MHFSIYSINLKGPFCDATPLVLDYSESFVFNIWPVDILNMGHLSVIPILMNGRISQNISQHIIETNSYQT